MATTDPVLRIMLPFLQRADELQKHDPLMAYYCRMYALEKALEFDSKLRSKDAEGMIRAVLFQLEKDKKILKTSPDDAAYVEGFAANVFNKADRQDRAGRADKDTAKAFYAASLFMEMCRQFDSNRELKPEVEEKLKYAVWKAADIRKALTEGRRPMAGPPGSVAVPTDEELERELAAEPGASASGAASESVPTDEYGFPLVPTSGPGSAAGPSSSPSTSVRTDEHGLPIAPASGAALTRGPSFSPFNPEEQQGYQGHPPPDSYSVISSAPPDGGTPTQAIFGMHSSSTPPAMPPPPTSFPSAAASSGPSSSLYPSSPAPKPPDHFPPPNVGPSQPYPQATTAPAMHYSHPGPGGAQMPSGYSGTPGSTGLAPSRGRGSFPPPDRVAEAHKAARSAVSALGFDDVNTGVEYLQRALSLLTKP